MTFHRLTIAIAACLIAGGASASGNAVKGGSTGLEINNSRRIDLVSSTPIQYFNRSVAQGRQIVNLRVGQPVLCADFAQAPAGNRVGLSITDPNNDATPPMYGGITSFTYTTNGAQPSSFKVNSDGNLACCTMLPAINASCVQGSVGGLVLNELFANGFEGLASAIEGTAPTNLVVTASAPTTINAGGSLAYSFTITNTGGSASGIKIRDWFPKSPVFSTSLGTGSWVCVDTITTGAVCGVSGTQTGNVALEGVALNQGSAIRIDITRPVAAAATNGSTLSVSAAAFAPPSENEADLLLNQAARTVTVGVFSYTVNPSTLNFNGIVGVPTNAQNVNVAAGSGNGGILVINNCTFGGSHPSDFAFQPAPNFPLQIAVGGNLNLPVRFTGTATGARSATLNCTTNATSPTSPSFAVTLNGTASAPNSPPTISDIGNQTGIEELPTAAIAFTASDSDDVLTPASFSCNDSALVAPSGCQFAGSEPNFTVTLTPKNNANGSANVQVTVTDGSNNSASDSFLLTVQAVNDAPDFSLPANVSYGSGTSGARSISNFVQNRVPGGGPDELSQTTSVASVVVTSGASIFVTGAGPSYDSGKNVLAFALNGTSGTATVRVRVEDNGANGGPNGDVNFRERDFTITVQPPSRID